MYYPDETTADALQAWHEERMDADLEQAAMEREGRHLDALRRMGICTHGSAVGWIAKPVYPEQKNLQPGQVACTSGCGTVFDSDDAWYAALADPTAHPKLLRPSA
ncbi:hypothetical protein [Streptomyces chilikensis]|uniref:Uncharacterized protein n=1 Tax=Streptomyces chilikensis TaxID=1194079 RepID=A0ABV3EJB4_9ACTN